MGFSPSNYDRQLLAHLPRSLEELILSDELYSQNAWNWDAEGYYDMYDGDDDYEHPWARAGVIVDAV